MDSSAKLFAGEKLSLGDDDENAISTVTDEEIDAKYVKGEVRIVTEQARYPLTAIPGMLDGRDYQLNPEFQRRHRWDAEKKSRLIESFIMNVPVPPIFLYEDKFSHYEVMDGLQRLTAIYDFYKDRFALEGLREWPELNGRKYSNLPDQIRRGIDRRHLSSIILLQETAKSEVEALRLKQLVFERINSGGVLLEHQEARNAIYDGPMNRMCIRLARHPSLCRAWGIPEPTPTELSGGDVSPELLQNETYRTMFDVELVLRFFAYRQRLDIQKGALSTYLDVFLQKANLFPRPLLAKLDALFCKTIELVFDTFGEQAFWLWRKRNESWNWLRRPTTTVYDPMMYVFSQHLHEAEQIRQRAPVFQKRIVKVYQNNYDVFEGRYTNRSNTVDRNRLFEKLITSVLAERS